MRRTPVDIYRKVGKDVDMDYKDVRTIVNAAYSELQRCMGHETEPYLMMMGLGNFEVKLPRLFEVMRWHSARQDKALELKNEYNQILFDKYQALYDRLKLIQLDIEVQMQRKYETRARYHELMAKKNKENNKEQ